MRRAEWIERTGWGGLNELVPTPQPSRGCPRGPDGSALIWSRVSRCAASDTTAAGRIAELGPPGQRRGCGDGLPIGRETKVAGPGRGPPGRRVSAW
ncbi:hypothetical protein NDU88_000057 [Pleurodeles waltl]|uniref:Uncharacterized protein n=1 Tax=Pleurodeles waltl TaxID=8319 RepID=A0AAV7S730_PLEWA|nr:hypothetical protein NDU88_000057 [Pleurodeles waltl]